MICENQTPNDAQLFDWLEAQEQRLDQEARAARAEAVTVAGPIPSGWAYSKALRDPRALTREQRRRCATPPVSGWIAIRPATREWLFGVRTGVEQLCSGSSEPIFVEDWSSREANRKRLESEIAVAPKQVTEVFNGTEWVPDFETAFLPDGRPFARRGHTAGGWLQWQPLDAAV